MSDYGGNQVILEIAPNVFAIYGHLQPGSLKVKAGDTLKAGAPLARLGNTGPSRWVLTCISVSSTGPTCGAGRSLPFVFESFTVVGVADIEASQGDTIVVSPESQRGSFQPIRSTAACKITSSSKPSWSDGVPRARVPATRDAA